MREAQIPAGGKSWRRTARAPARQTAQSHERQMSWQAHRILRRQVTPLDFPRQSNGVLPLGLKIGQLNFLKGSTFHNRSTARKRFPLSLGESIGGASHEVVGATGWTTTPPLQEWPPTALTKVPPAAAALGCAGSPSTKREGHRPGWLGTRSGTRGALLFARR